MSTPVVIDYSSLYLLSMKTYIIAIAVVLLGVAIYFFLPEDDNAGIPEDANSTQESNSSN